MKSNNKAVTRAGGSGGRVVQVTLGRKFHPDHGCGSGPPTAVRIREELAEFERMGCIFDLMQNDGEPGIAWSIPRRLAPVVMPWIKEHTDRLGIILEFRRGMPSPGGPS